MTKQYDAVVVGAGPNGLAAGIRLAQKGLAVLLVEANTSVGGGARSDELTLPGFRHDVCSAIHPMAAASPFLASLPLDRHGLKWIHPGVPLAHPLDGGVTAVLRRSLDETATQLGNDGEAYRRLFGSFAAEWESLTSEILQPIIHVPQRPVMLARFGIRALRSATGLARRFFDEPPARALFAGLAAHSFLSLDAPGSAAIGIVLGAAGHVGGWPMPRGGTQVLSDAMAAHFLELGGTIETSWEVKTLDELPLARVIMLDLTPRQVIGLAGHRLPKRYNRALSRYRYGPAAFKVDYALEAPIPWQAAGCEEAGTVHIGGTLEEVADSERMMAAGLISERPFVLLAQPTLFDPTRAPEGKHIAWAYCHVPNGCTTDMTQRLEDQIERFAPGFRERVLARHITFPADLEARNANLVGGDIGGGLANLSQLVARPVLSHAPYRTPARGVYICSSSTPPGGGVHGMCGFHAANTAIRDHFR